MRLVDPLLCEHECISPLGMGVSVFVSLFGNVDKIINSYFSAVACGHSCFFYLPCCCLSIVLVCLLDCEGFECQSLQQLSESTRLQVCRIPRTRLAIISPMPLEIGVRLEHKEQHWSIETLWMTNGVSTDVLPLSLGLMLMFLKSLQCVWKTLELV